MADAQPGGYLKAVKFNRYERGWSMAAALITIFSKSKLKGVSALSYELNSHIQGKLNPEKEKKNPL